jgi:hypothetical protein
LEEKRELHGTVEEPSDNLNVFLCHVTRCKG